MDCKILGLRVTASANAFGSFRQIVWRMAKLNVGPSNSQYAPGSPNGHPPSASVHHSSSTNRSVELHVRTTAPNYSDLKPFKVQALLTAAAQRACVPLLLPSTVNR